MILLACESIDSKAGARALLLRAMGEGYGLKQLPAMEYGPRGKPFFPGHPNIHFNLSHSGPYALCAVGECPVGVDIEVLRPRRATVPAGVFTEGEYRWYEEQGGGWSAFYTLWTRKESWVKYHGGAVARPKTVCPPLPGTSQTVPYLASLSGPDWHAAICAEEPIPFLQWIIF